VIYEKVSKTSYTPSIQGLLLAQTLTLSPSEKSVLEENKEAFADM